MTGNEFGRLMVIIFCIVVFSMIGLALLCLILKAIAKRYVKKKRQKLFKSKKDLCDRCKNDGDELMNRYDTYLHYIDELKLNETVRCSSSVVAGASEKPLKYILKYANIGESMEDLELLDFVAEFLGDYEKFLLQVDNVRFQLRPKLPLILRLFTDKKSLPFVVCGLDETLRKIRVPCFRFLYVSPANRSSHDCRIMISSDVAAELRDEISQKLGKKAHAKTQRSAMSNDLREAIKLRDNYTCQECGNSVYDEPNLLLEVDHIIPISKGGKTEASNLQTLCWRCNRKKSDN